MILKVENLEKSYKSGFIPKPNKVLKGISFEVGSGDVVGFIGANGAGKSTTIKCMLGLVKPDQGEITYFSDKKLSPKLFKRIGFLPERPNFYNFLTGKELLTYFGKLSGVYTNHELSEKIKHMISRVGLDHAKDRLIKSYSKGMNQRVGIAQALLHDPDFIVLDEPLSGLDPDGRYQLSDIINEAAQSGKTIFFSSHLLDDTQRICNKVVIIDKGEVKYDGSTVNLLSKISSTYVVSFYENDTLKVKEVSNQSDLNTLIADIVKNGYVIDSIMNSSNTLEKAYVNLLNKDTSS